MPKEDLEDFQIVHSHSSYFRPSIDSHTKHTLIRILTINQHSQNLQLIHSLYLHHRTNNPFKYFTIDALPLELPDSPA